MWLRFIRGFASGAVVTLIAVVASVLLLERYGFISIQTEKFANLRFALQWLFENLGLSLFAFALLIVWYLAAMSTLARALSSQAPLAEVQQAEQRVDTIVALVFGVGVIWTAVGMRGALTFALGGGAEAVDQSAAVVLDRLVSGGMLVALSSTIAGGVLGYTMRVLRQLSLGHALRQRYQLEQQEQSQQFAVMIADALAGAISKSEVSRA